MDPNCAICHASASVACDCEAKGLEVAVKEAEQRVMRSIYADIRFVMDSRSQYKRLTLRSTWVRAHAQDYILDYFHQLTESRKAEHSAMLDRMTSHAWHHYNRGPNPQNIAEVQAHLKRGIDEDWQASVQRYPEVLTYFFNLVEITLPADDEPGVTGLSMGSLPSHRKTSRQQTGGNRRRASIAAPMPAITYREEPLPSRTPPPLEYRRGPRDRRSGGFRPAIQQPAYFAQKYA